jgi:hypothetical protein
MKHLKVFVQMDRSNESIRPFHFTAMLIVYDLLLTKRQIIGQKYLETDGLRLFGVFFHLPAEYFACETRTRSLTAD